MPCQRGYKHGYVSQQTLSGPPRPLDGTGPVAPMGRNSLSRRDWKDKHIYM